MSDAPDQNELLAEAIGYIRGAEEAWRQQIEYALGHGAELLIDYDSLRGNYVWLQPFVHQVITGSLGALTGVGFDPQCHDALAAAAQRVLIACTGAAAAAGGACEVKIAGGLIEIGAPVVLLPPEEPQNRPIDPTFEIANAIRRTLGLPEQAPPAYAFGVNAGETETAGAGDDSAEHGDPSESEESSDSEFVEFAKRDPGASEIALQGRYAHAEKLAQKLEAVMRELDVWPGDPPPGPIEIRGAFGCQNMAFTQWLAWVLIPVIYQTIDEQGEFPSESYLAAYCVRELSGMQGEKELHDVLYAIDHLGGKKKRR